MREPEPLGPGRGLDVPSTVTFIGGTISPTSAARWLASERGHATDKLNMTTRDGVLRRRARVGQLCHVWLGEILPLGRRAGPTHKRDRPRVALECLAVPARRVSLHPACTDFALRPRLVLLVEGAGQATSGPASLTLAGGHPSAPHGPMAGETSAAHRVLVNDIAEASRSDSGSWLMAAPVRGSSGILGVLVAASSNGTVLSEEQTAVVHAITCQLAQAIDRDKRAEDQRVNDQSTSAIRRLLEEGSRASTVHEARTILAQVAADAFHCERAGMYAVDKDGVISFTVGVGVPPETCDALATALVGKRANDSPAWQRTAQRLAPVLVGDAKLLPVRPGGLVETLGFKSYVALPLLSADGHIGYVMCGDVAKPRAWAHHDEALARQLALEGALVVDNARLREYERAQLAEMERQAFHDRLTDLPNRALLAERMEEGLAKADTGDAALALLLLDLDDFKQVTTLWATITATSCCRRWAPSWRNWRGQATLLPGWAATSLPSYWSAPVQLPVPPSRWRSASISGSESRFGLPTSPSKRPRASGSPCSRTTTGTRRRC